MFLDDGYGCSQSLDGSIKLSQHIKNDLLSSGFIPNATKCIWSPTQVLEFLGVMLDSGNSSIFIPGRRLLKCINGISEILNSIKVHRYVHVKKVASCIGQIISMSVVIGKVSQIMTRNLSIDVLAASHWDQYIKISDESKRQLEFWQISLSELNIKHTNVSFQCSKIVYSDASSTGFAGYAVSAKTGISYGTWSIEESLKSSTWRELVAVYRVLQSLGHILTGQRVKWFTDNQGVEAIVSKGSMKVELQSIAIDIFRFCIAKSILLEMEWIPRTMNEKADYLPKIIDIDDWGISFEIFDMIQARFGNIHIDWFASEHNAKLNSYYSRYWSPTCNGIDAFSEQWGGKFGLFVPPITVITQVIKKMAFDKAVGVLVVPCWKSALFWPFLCPTGSFIPEIHKTKIDQLPEVMAGKVHLLPNLLKKSRADSTSSKYHGAFVRFQKWVSCNGLGSGDALPAKSFIVAIYLASLIQSVNSPSPVIAAFYAIKWYHDINGLYSPTNSKLVENILEAAKRVLGKPVVKKEPITVDIITSLYNRLYEYNNIKNQRTICAFLIGFSGFLRSREMLSIKISNIVFHTTYMAIFMEGSKTDKYRDGSWIMIAKTGTNICPVDNTVKLIKWANLNGDDYLFCNLSATKTGHKVRNVNKKMSYTNLRDIHKCIEASCVRCEKVLCSFFKIWGSHRSS
ncbi:uncharacterized protein [Palaemon carinicauda]|uniref:uncharacterized protein n=1 Tax=Palaemon carinicauda TaxID=392227 RepID=UPI0035B68269